MTTGPGISRTPLPLGFATSGLNSGVRKYRPDLGLIVSDRDAVTAGVFTRNECKAAPILYCQKLLPSVQVRAIVTNSGQANAATGQEGVRRNQILVDSLAREMKCQPDQIMVASTGVIGHQIDIEKIQAALPELVARTTDNAEAFALAILTTDLVPKSASIEVPLSGGSVRITGICKGSGMIHPNMGTMLGYLLTDADLEISQAQTWVREVADVSFNMVSVDGDTSTNDCVYLMANGASKVKVREKSDVEKFKHALTQVAQVLAQSIARDGEGATKLIEVTLTRAPDLELARQAARGLIVSPLFKSAMHGEDPNWGRALARLGAEGISAKYLGQMDLKIQDTWVYRDGAPVTFDRPAARLELKKDTVKIFIDLKTGTHQVTAWGCDLTKKYVEINTEYS